MQVLFDDAPCHEAAKGPSRHEVRILAQVFKSDEATVPFIRIPVAANDVRHRIVRKRVEKSRVVTRKHNAKIPLLSDTLDAFEEHPCPTRMDAVIDLFDGYERPLWRRKHRYPNG